MPDDIHEQVRQAEQNLRHKERAHQSAIDALDRLAARIREEIALTINAMKEVKKS